MTHDAVVVGSGPNGLAVAIMLARRWPIRRRARGGQQGRWRNKIGAADSLGFMHDVCSGVIRSVIVSPFLVEHPCGRPRIAVAAPRARPGPSDRRTPGGPVAPLSVADTAGQFDAAGGATAPARSNCRPVDPIVESAPQPVLSPPRHPIALGFRVCVPCRPPRIGRYLGEESASACSAAARRTPSPLPPADRVVRGGAAGERAHGGWPFVAGGSQAIADSMAPHLRSLGGEIDNAGDLARRGPIPPRRRCSTPTPPTRIDRRWSELQPVPAPVDQLPVRSRRRGRSTTRSTVRCRGRTRHAGGPARAPRRHPRRDRRRRGRRQPGPDAERPFVLAVQHSLVDPSRAPAGKHTLWTYADVPNGYSGDATDALERQIERFAPGFRDLILARNVITPSGFSRTTRTVAAATSPVAHTAHAAGVPTDPGAVSYRTPNQAIWLCSASTPPGAACRDVRPQRRLCRPARTARLIRCSAATPSRAATCGSIVATTLGTGRVVAQEWSLISLW